MNAKFHGTLRHNPSNPRYFTDDTGQAIFLTGSHTWATLQELKIDGQGEEANFKYDAFLDMLEENGHNFSRYWQWGYTEYAPWTDEKIIFEPLAYERPGPGIAGDGKQKFDLDRFNEKYFERLRERIVKAGERGIYVSVQFFDGWCLKCRNKRSDPWLSSPFKVDNNINEVDADPKNTGDPLLFTLEFPLVVEYQKSFIRKVIDTLNDLDFVLWEIINELARPQHFARMNAWHEHMINYVIEYERTKPKQHPVCKSAAGLYNKLNDDLFISNAHWVTVDDNFSREYKYNPPAADGRKVVVADTDHIWGHGGTYIWAWKSFLRGMMPIFMDPWVPTPGREVTSVTHELNQRDYIEWVNLRKNLGYILSYSKRMNLNMCVPRNDLAYGDYCLAWGGNQYIVYNSEDCQLRLDMSDCEGDFAVEWFDPRTGVKQDGDVVAGGKQAMRFLSPFGLGSVLFVNKI